MLILNSSFTTTQFIRTKVSWYQEHIWLITLNANKSVIKDSILFKGTVNFCNFHSRDLIREVCLDNAHSFILVHNHINQNSYPSKSDFVITKKVKDIAQLIGVEFLDHIIICKKDYYSFADMGLV